MFFPPMYDEMNNDFLDSKIGFHMMLSDTYAIRMLMLDVVNLRIL